MKTLGVNAVLLIIVSAINGQQYSPSSGQQAISDTPSWSPDLSNVAKIENIDVQCEKDSIAVNIQFSGPFNGIIFSKGHYSNPECIHLQAGSGSSLVSFLIQQNSCGLLVPDNNNGQPNPSGTSIENTIVIQYDPRVQEVWDQARKIKCTWYDYYEKSVSFQPFKVNMLNSITANFLGDSLQCWMQIQVGKGPWASEVSGIVKIGQTMTMVLGIKDDERKFDMMVRNCVAHDGQKLPIQLVDENGCVIRKKIMSQFEKIQNFGPSASVVSYAYFQAFKFPDSVNVHFQCVIQVCRFSCPKANCPHDQNIDRISDNYGSFSHGNQRKRRDLTEQNSTFGETLDVPASIQFQVLDPDDMTSGSKNVLDFDMSSNTTEGLEQEEDFLCLSLPSPTGITFSFMVLVLVTSCLHTIISCATMKSSKKKYSY